METTLWILQALLATVFLLTGTVKLTQSRVRMAAGPMSWAWPTIVRTVSAHSSRFPAILVSRVPVQNR